MKFDLEPLPYPVDALEPYIDAQTMQLHHDKHHAAYVSNLNNALANHPEVQVANLDQLLANLANIPEDIRTTVRNHGGGTWNHNLFWKIMKPGGSAMPKGNLIVQIEKSFKSFENFQQEFSQRAGGLFGSGWVWLVKGGDDLKIVTTPNQDNPLAESLQPILGLDVWEHAYYLRYQNRRADYVSNWWKVVNWDEVARNYGE